MKNKRGLKSAVVEPSAQLRMLVPFALLLAVHVGSYVWLHHQTQEMFTRMHQRESDELSAAAMVLSSTIINTSIYSMFAFVALMLLLWIRYSHRIFGPVIPINRQLDRLIAGEYDGQIQLRRADELKVTADKINELTTKLKA